MPASFRCSLVATLTASGTSWGRSTRFWAVTTISAMEVLSASLTELPASTTAGAVWAQAAVDINCAINATKEAFLIAITLTSPDDRQIESRRQIGRASCRERVCQYV